MPGSPRFKKNLLYLLVLAITLATCGCRGNQEALPTIDQAMETYREGDTSRALEMLQAIAKSDPKGRVGDEAALVLGNLLIGEQKHDAAVPYLRRAEGGQQAPLYAKLLLVRAIVEGGLSDQYQDAEERAMLLARETGEASDLVREEAAYFLVQIYRAQNRAKETTDYAKLFLSNWPRSKRSNEVRWIAAESLEGSGQPRDAYDLYAAIWYTTPSSAWAKQSQAKMLELGKELSLPPKQLEPGQRYEFIKALQGAGLHADAVSEAETYLSGSAIAANADGVLLLKIISLYALVKNNEVVRVVEELLKKYPSSKWVPSAGIYAVQALRRMDNEPAVRKWANWVHANYPRHPKGSEALYNLGVFLQNQGKLDEGNEILLQMVREVPDCNNADDALWKIAWADRRKGETGRSVATLRELLARYPKSGYRKACLYWIARFTADEDRGGAKELYQTLLREFPNDYYGHEASKNLLALGEQPRQIGNGISFPPIDRLDQTDSQRGRAYNLAVHLKQVGLYEFAARELQRQENLEGNPALQFALADLYSHAGATVDAFNLVRLHFPQFIIAGSRDPRLVPLDFWYVIYPFNYRPIVSRAIKEAKLDESQIEPLLVAALIRMESLFEPSAISPVGAIGLMQLMPDTAAQIARERNLAPPTRADLFRPDVNIRYGTYYLAARVKDFRGDWFPAICSYNAGVGPVRSWWNKKPPEQPIDEFIENIPYIDTRLYIKQVLADYRNYEWIYKQRR